MGLHEMTFIENDSEPKLLPVMMHTISLASCSTSTHVCHIYSLNESILSPICLFAAAAMPLSGCATCSL